MSPGQ